jgi:hypothetical protein
MRVRLLIHLVDLIDDQDTGLVFVNGGHVILDLVGRQP